MSGDGVFIPKKPLPKTGIKKNQGTITLIKPKIMPLKSEILSNIIEDNINVFNSIYNDFENKCIESDFNLLKNKNSHTKLDLFNVIVNSLDFKKPNSN